MVITIIIKYKLSGWGDTFITYEKTKLDARAYARRREHQITRFLRNEGIPAFHTDVFDIIMYIFGKWYGIELKENHRNKEKWNLTVHTKTWKNQIELSEKTGMKRAVIYISKPAGNWVIETTESIDRRVRKSKGQLTKITIKNMKRISLRKWLHMIGITDEIPDY